MNQSMKLELSRRSFLGLSLAAAGGALLSCATDHKPGAPGDPGVDSDDPFAIWAALRAALRTSPDHLAATADRLVAAGDPAQLFEFVRDQIASYPPSGLDGAVTEVRWGARGTLRGGAGTPREKAELLVELYRRAGFAAEVVVGTVASRLRSDAAARAYLRPVTRSFAPGLAAATLAQWKAAMAKVGTLGSAALIDPDDSERRALVAAIGALVPGDAAAKLGPFDATLDTVAIVTQPLVAVTVDGIRRFANPLFAEASFGDALTDDRPSPAPPADPAPRVVVELAVSTTAAPTERITVATASYAADQLAGRQLLLQFAPMADLDTLARLRIADIHAFRPILSVRGPDVEVDGDPSFVVVGSELTLRGDIVDTTADGTVLLDGRPLLAPSAIDPAAAARVASVAATVHGAAFPTVRVEIAARDAGGAGVDGLSAPDFALRDAGVPVGFVVGATPAEPVRVFLDFDLDGPLATGEDPDDFARRLTSAIAAAHPGALIVTGVDGAYTESADPEVVAAAVSGGDSDDPWADLASAAAARPMLTVIVSDFEGLTDPRDPSAPKGAYRAQVAAGPPVVAISTDRAVVAAPDQLAALTGGTSLPGGGIAAGIAAVLDRLAARTAGGGSYTLTYTAPLDAPDQRAVTVAINQRSASASYDVPPLQARAEQGGLAGIYLTVSLGDATVTRVLGGYASAQPPEPGVPIAQAVLDDVRDSLFGVSMLSFEAAAPSLATALDDVLAIKLAVEPLWRAVAAGDSDAIRANLASLRSYVPAELSLMQCAPAASSTSSTTFEDGLRIVHCAQRPRFGHGRQRRLDMLPLSGWATVSASARTSFVDTLARSARVAVVEGHALATATLGALAGVRLRLIPPGTIDASDLPYPAAVAAPAAEILNQLDGHYRLVPDAGDFTGCWAVSAQSGSLIGVLPDGSGGAAQSEECAELDQLSNALTALGLVASLAGVAGLGPYFWLGKQVASVALLSAAILDNQEVGQPTGAPLNGLAAAAACDAAQLAALTGASAAGGDLGDAADAVDNAQSVASLAGVGVDCPNALSGVGCG